MSIITVLGATGSQGGSVCTALQGNPHWKVRAVTRNPASNASRKLLEKGIEVVAADANDETSLHEAFRGTTAVFALTNFDWGLVMKKGREAAGEVEKQQQINIAKAAAQTPGLKHYIMSSLPAASLSSNGKLPVPHFDYKHEAFQWIEEHAPELAAKTTRVWLGWYPSNMAFNAMMKLVHLPSPDVYAWIQPSKEDAVLPIAGDAQHNVGVVVEGILEDGPRSFGRIAIVITDYLKLSEVVKVWESVTGKRAVYIEVSDKTTEKIWGVGGLEIASQLRWSEEFPNWHKLEPERVITLEGLGVQGKVRNFKQALESVKENLI
ncbi:NmrA domain-containing protein [Fusarium keratoplasticum]|uniref:NmrA domain-containing protein n=1 Tax=Fusarium keratoplasticum TaxID=1328300 RepID=A0ACC0QPE0_9HYPO|nr:NmrA domain-containing protein [Fusarium keratoplasticum]KAI8660967.1 NmrA domain-containing protein [Fusarium keratoplasticum]KAI8661985.1 NmrA domain-containing protein [Fusarium keratoplasticum]